MTERLILGNGLLGTELQRLTGWKCVPHEFEGFDLFEPWNFGFYLSDGDPIINCTGHTKEHKDRFCNMELNFRAVIDLVEYCNTHRKKYVHISTDIVYSGSVHFASEDDVPVHAPNWYAYSKLLADGYVQTVCADYLLIRTAFKPRPFPYSVAFNKFGNFDYVDVIAELIVKLIEADVKGVYNVGTRFKSMCEHARETVPNVQVSFKSDPVDVSMNLDKMKGAL
jgi:dTDP-4-dehydrorhamnose reductase